MDNEVLKKDIVIPIDIYSSIILKPLAKVNDNMPFSIYLRNISNISIVGNPKDMTPKELHSLVIESIKKAIDKINVSVFS